MRLATGRLSPLERTAFITVHARALDAAQADPILGDRWAGPTLEATDVDLDTISSSRFVLMKERLNVATRGLIEDGLVRAFLAEHRTGAVVDLGAGLDARPLRIGTHVDWYSLDLPGITQLAEQLRQMEVLPFPQSVRLIAADLREPGWARHLPADRPVLAISDGLYPTMTDAQYAGVLRELTARVPSGQLIQLGLSKLSARALAMMPSLRKLGLQVAPGFDDPRQLERWNPALRLDEVLRHIDAPVLDKFPWSMRIQAKALRPFPKLTAADGLFRLSWGFPTPPQT